MPKSKGAPSFDLERSLPALCAVLQARRVLKRSNLKALKVPAEHQDQVLGRLAGQGFEPIPDGVRVPLREQLATLLQQRTVVSGALGKQLKGGNLKEYKELIIDQARAGSIQLLVRGKAEALTGSATPVLSREELRALGQLASSVQKALRSKALPKTLLREDVRELLLDLAAPLPSPTPAAPAPPPALGERLVTEARRLLHPDLKLCFVPDLVLACLDEHSLSGIHDALGLAVREGRMELRPESGLNRLSPLELALCPEGLQGSRLSWARPLQPGS